MTPREWVIRIVSLIKMGDTSVNIYATSLFMTLNLGILKFLVVEGEGVGKQHAFLLAFFLSGDGGDCRPSTAELLHFSCPRGLLRNFIHVFFCSSASWKMIRAVGSGACPQVLERRTYSSTLVQSSGTWRDSFSGARETRYCRGLRNPQLSSTPWPELDGAGPRWYLGSFVSAKTNESKHEDQSRRLVADSSTRSIVLPERYRNVTARSSGTSGALIPVTALSTPGFPLRENVLLKSIREKSDFSEMRVKPTQFQFRLMCWIKVESRCCWVADTE